MFTFGVRTILLLLVIAGAVAIIGDYIGRSIGRKRISIFKLRPRNTALLFTAITGILIALTTVGILLAVSQDARTALFGLEELRNHMDEQENILIETKREAAVTIAAKDKAEEEKKIIDQELTAAKDELQKSEAKIAQLKRTEAKLAKEAKTLEKKLDKSRRGKVLFKAGETLLVSVIQAGPEKEKLQTGLKQILSAGDAYVRSFGIKSDKHLILIMPDDFNQTVSELQNHQNEVIVKLVSTRNSLFGEEVPVQFKVSKNHRIYKAGETITEASIKTSSIPEIEQQIKNLLILSHQTAKEDGVIPDATGSVGSIPYSEIFALSKKINNHRKNVDLKIVAKKNIYSMGPLEIKFKVYYK
jgi:uncharacterized protein (DUF3084 family)